MPEVIQLPTGLKPFQFFGIEFDHEEGKDQAIGRCPFCSRDGKLYIHPETGQFDCKVCGEEGNVYSLMRKVYDASSFVEGEGEQLAADRKVPASALEAWGLRTSFLSGDWLIPGYGADGKLNQLYRRIWNYGEKRWYLNGPKGVNHALHGVPLYDPKKRDVYLCEGIWDGVCLWDVLRRVKSDDTDTLSPTGNLALSLSKDANVLATPSCNVFNDSWCSLFAGKRVFLCFDNDHPAKVSRVCGAFEGMKYVASVLAQSAEPPAEMHYLQWANEEGAEYDHERKHGYDLRDLLTGGEDHLGALDEMMSRFRPVPPGWVKGGTGSKGKVIVPTLPCEKWETVVAACKRAIVFTEGLDRGLSVSFACAASVDVAGDQLWMKFIAPPSGGKTTLCDGLSMARKFAVLKSITTGLHSGYREAEGDGEDVSLMASIRGKAMIVKDADTMIQADNLPKIQSELRDAYDTRSSTHYRNGVVRDYENHRFVVMLYGTSQLRKMDASELGQRFLDCVIMEGVDEKIEKKINRFCIDQFELLMSNQATANGDRIEGKERQEAKQLIGGYLEHLRRTILSRISDIKFPTKAKEAIQHYADLIALFRARPSSYQTEDHTRELSTRLLLQLSKLAYCLAVVLNRKEVDAEVLRRVRQCALDTARGKTLKVAVQLFKVRDGIDPTSLGQRVNMEGKELRPLLIFMRAIDIVETFVPKAKVGLGSSKMKWRLTDNVRKLYSHVMK